MFSSFYYFNGSSWFLTSFLPIVTEGTTILYHSISDSLSHYDVSIALIPSNFICHKMEKLSLSFLNTKMSRKNKVLLNAWVKKINEFKAWVDKTSCSYSIFDNDYIVGENNSLDFEKITKSKVYIINFLFFYFLV